MDVRRHGVHIWSAGRGHAPLQIACLWKVSQYLTRSLSLATVPLQVARLWNISHSLGPWLGFQ